MLSLSAASRAGVSGVPRPRLGFGPGAAPSPPARAAPEQCPPQPGSPRAPAAVAVAAAAQAAVRAGRKGGAAPGRSLGLRAPSPSAVLATAAGPVRSSGGRGALPSRHGNHARQGRSQDPVSARPPRDRSLLGAVRRAGPGDSFVRGRQGAPQIQRPPWGGPAGEGGGHGAGLLGKGWGLGHRDVRAQRAAVLSLGLSVAPAVLPIPRSSYHRVPTIPMCANEVGAAGSPPYHLRDAWPA